MGALCFGFEMTEQRLTEKRKKLVNESG